MCRGSSLSLPPRHRVCSVACPLFTLRFLFQFVLFFLCLLVINLGFLEPFLFCASLSWFYVILFCPLFSSVSQLTFQPVPNSASSPFPTFLLTFLIPSSFVLRFIFDSHLLRSFLLDFPRPFLFYLPPVPSVSTNPYHIHHSCFSLSYSWRLGTAMPPEIVLQPNCTFLVKTLA